ncbi:JAB domain-containing protein [Erythrobacter sp. HL-111]|uniref:JAB domain-containing protein n=1 Tax=Erythrobacter sp. HL-111 TaxID=1798193 RepID=UPI0006DA41DB|nr:JAB domain-containing protein [Erythrobacter sp. HL-111]KPP89484.1 MAG: DNA repair protein RadC [Erythrobacteraceae bacterium HL-111]SDS47347.1 RadC-like JAB domain-containing protein [Erythrobacter sp. HL-111]
MIAQLARRSLQPVRPGAPPRPDPRPDPSIEPRTDPREAHVAALIDHLRRSLIAAEGEEERFHAIFLDRSNAYLGDAGFGRGCGQALVLRMRCVFSRALELGTAGIVVAHNHPSGDCRPSATDIAATRRLGAVGAALDIELLDHLVITRRSVFSMRAGGLL